LNLTAREHRQLRPRPCDQTPLATDSNVADPSLSKVTTGASGLYCWSMSARRKIRELALQILFAWDANGERSDELARQITDDASDDPAPVSGRSIWPAAPGVPAKSPMAGSSGSPRNGRRAGSRGWIAISFAWRSTS
jgi:hypothetical protein